MHITSLVIDNFRSLKEVQIAKMQPVCIFHGLNNSGKSNILAALEAILKGKFILDAPVVAPDTEQKVSEQQSNFYKGRLRNFDDNFYLNNQQPITFRLCVQFDDEELSHCQKLLESITPERTARGAKNLRTLKLGDGHPKILHITGSFTFVDDQSSEMVSTVIAFNDKFVLYRIGEQGNVEYVPSLHESKYFDLAARVSFFEALMGKLTNSFQLIGADRFLGREKLAPDLAAALELKSDTLKQFLFALSTHKSRHGEYKKINERFSTAPFRFGELSFFIDPKTRELEVMIERSAVRLPLGRLGSGLQQILFLITNVLISEKKILGIEEIELNLSPVAQKDVFEMLKRMVFSNPKLIQQVIVTSHSPYFQNRDDVKYYGVSYNESQSKTQIAPATKSGLRKYFRLG